MPNTDKNYKQIGYLFAKYKFPYDFVSLEWAIDHYLETNIIPLLKEKNIYQTNVKNNIKIHNFDIQELRDSQQEESYLLKGDVYVYNLDKLNAGIDNTVFNKLPDDIGNQIKDYMGVKHEYSNKV
jgi:hypothetical protein